MDAVGAEVYLVNTGWNGKCERISIKDTRAIIDAILDGSLEKADSHTIPIFNLSVPKALPGVNGDILDPRASYSSDTDWTAKAQILAELFVENFDKFTDTDEGCFLVESGPKIKFD